MKSTNGLFKLKQKNIAKQIKLVYVHSLISKTWSLGVGDLYTW